MKLQRTLACGLLALSLSLPALAMNLNEFPKSVSCHGGILTNSDKGTRGEAGLPSARTRNSMEMAVAQLGGHPVYIQKDEVGIDTRETAEDDGIEEICVIGGVALFEKALPRAKRLYLTEVEAEPEGDVLFPAFDETAWTEVSSEAHPAGEKDDHGFVFRVLERK